MFIHLTDICAWLQTAFRMIDTKQTRFVSSQSLRAFLQSWFDRALDQVQSVPAPGNMYT